MASRKGLFSTAIQNFKFYRTSTHSGTGNTGVISGEFSDEQETHRPVLKDSRNKTLCRTIVPNVLNNFILFFVIWVQNRKQNAVMVLLFFYLKESGKKWKKRRLF